MLRFPKLKRLAVRVGALSAGLAALSLPGVAATGGGSAADCVVQSALLVGMNAVRAESGLSGVSRPLNLRPSSRVVEPFAVCER